MIPKIVHTCWFGRGEKSELLRGCEKSWDKLLRAGYELKVWNEDNLNMNENPFAAMCYEKKQWAYLSDYFRLKALYEYGGIYLDTDVYVYKPFDDLLDCDFLCGYIYDCALGTAVLGSAKHNSLTGQLTELWAGLRDTVVNNGLLTEYFHDKVPGFTLNGWRQSLTLPGGERVEIYPKETFETGKILGRGYTLHFSDASWGAGGKKTPAWAKLLAARLPVNVMAIRQRRKADAHLRGEGLYQTWYKESGGR